MGDFVQSGTYQKRFFRRNNEKSWSERKSLRAWHVGCITTAISSEL
jgi:hypothetical protein